MREDTTTIGYSLDPTSPARDAGAVLAYPSSLGALSPTTVPDGKPDIGALEMNSTGVWKGVRRFGGGLQLRGSRAVWNGWAISSGVIRVRLVDAKGRLLFAARQPHGVGAVDAAWSLPQSPEVRFLTIEMGQERESAVVGL